MMKDAYALKLAIFIQIVEDNLVHDNRICGTAKARRNTTQPIARRITVTMRPPLMLGETVRVLWNLM
jgi:hypothetical protein